MASGGYTSEFMARSGDIALVSGRNRYKSVTWEVWKIKRSMSARTWPSGAVTPKVTEASPSCEKWGVDGWTYTDEYRARKAYRDKIIQIRSDDDA